MCQRNSRDNKLELGSCGSRLLEMELLYLEDNNHYKIFFHKDGSDAVVLRW